MKKHFGAILAFVIIALFIANMVYIHIALRAIRAQCEPGTPHDWKALLEAVQK